MHYLDTKGSRPKKTYILSMSAKALSLPPLWLNGHMNKNVFFFSCIKVYVFETRKA